MIVPVSSALHSILPPAGPDRFANLADDAAVLVFLTGRTETTVEQSCRGSSGELHLSRTRMFGDG